MTQGDEPVDPAALVRPGERPVGTEQTEPFDPDLAEAQIDRAMEILAAGGFRPGAGIEEQPADTDRGVRDPEAIFQNRPRCNAIVKNGVRKGKRCPQPAWHLSPGGFCRAHVTRAGLHMIEAKQARRGLEAQLLLASEQLAGDESIEQGTHRLLKIVRGRIEFFRQMEAGLSVEQFNGGENPVSRQFIQMTTLYIQLLRTISGQAMVEKLARIDEATGVLVKAAFERALLTVELTADQRVTMIDAFRRELVSAGS